MFRGRGPILIIFSLLLAMGAAWMAKQWVHARMKPTTGQSPTVPVVTAAMDIPFSTKVEDRHLAVIQMIRGTEPSGSFRSKADVEGKVSRAALLSGEILLQGRFAERGDGSTLAAVVEKNMRAVTVRVDDVVGVAGFLLPGNRVDVIAARDLNRGLAETKTILQNVRVLAVDQTASSDKNEPVVVRAVTLEVTPDQAEILLKGKEEGSIQLTLRNPLDGDVQQQPQPKRTVVKARPKKVDPGITVIRGTQVATQETRQ
jgi:pilus assembly protein CpaB